MGAAVDPRGQGVPRQRGRDPHWCCRRLCSWQCGNPRDRRWAVVEGRPRRLECVRRSLPKGGHSQILASDWLARGTTLDGFARDSTTCGGPCPYPQVEVVKDLHARRFYW